jgi:hypothetical protein
MSRLRQYVLEYTNYIKRARCATGLEMMLESTCGRSITSDIGTVHARIVFNTSHRKTICEKN